MTDLGAQLAADGLSMPGDGNQTKLEAWVRGVPMGVIAARLGHSETRMTEKHYAHLSPSYVAEAVRQSFGTLGIVPDTTVTALRRTG